MKAPCYVCGKVIDERDGTLSSDGLCCNDHVTIVRLPPSPPEPQEYPWGEWVRTMPGEFVDGYFVRVRPYGAPKDDKPGEVYVAEFEIRDWECPVPEGPDPDNFLFRGSIKWDGCANFGSDPGLLIHLCGPFEVPGFMKALLLAWTEAAKILTRPDFLEDLPKEGL